MTSAIDGSYDIGMASRELQDDEEDKLDSQAMQQTVSQLL